LKTILVVDDDLANVAVIRLILQGQGYQVLTAWNGQDGLKILNAQTVDLIVCDLRMPIMGGEEMCRILRESPVQPQPRIILMSATAHPPSADSLHYDRFLPKPFKLAQLNAAVQSTIGETDEAR
jgi:CheY-like chemotaxis protein